jgi:hypothetical protein
MDFVFEQGWGLEGPGAAFYIMSGGYILQVDPLGKRKLQQRPKTFTQRTLKFLRKHDRILGPLHLQQASISGHSNAGGDEPLAGITAMLR